MLPVRIRPGKKKRMVQGEQTENHGTDYECECPGERYVIQGRLQQTGNEDKPALPEYRGKPVERTSDTHEKRLSFTGQGQHVKTVGSYIVRSRCKSRNPEHGQRGRKGRNRCRA